MLVAVPAGDVGAQARVEYGGPLGWVEVRLAEQHAYLYRPDGTLAARVPVSTGAAGSRTPRGSFTVQRKQASTRASSDLRVGMDWFVAFKGGYALHGIPWRSNRSNRLATPLGQRPVSHGCVRMDDEVARWVFHELPMGARVVVK